MTVCKACNGEVRNVEHKRHTIEKLMAIHRASCPAGRARHAREDVEHEQTTKNEMLAALGSQLREEQS